MIPENEHIKGAFFKAIANLDTSKNTVVSVSGGSDSDIVIDFIHQCGASDKVNYVFFDTGLEYQATKEHLDYLEKRYNIKIERLKAYRSIPYCCKNYGLPFINKFISEQIDRLQRHNFKFEDKPLEELIKEYPGCLSSLKWWTNNHVRIQWNISYKKFLKEFLIENPPDFKISSKCCTYAKKKTAKDYYKKNNIELVVLGLRKAEGGIRSYAYSSCYSTGNPDSYRPIWWLTDEDKREYNKFYQIKNSRAYTQYGFRRTGCACCPFGLELNEELKKTAKYEPKLYNAILKTFGRSYDYTERYYQFRKEKEQELNRLSMKTKPLEFYEVIE